MGKIKIIRDSVLGYIEIEELFVKIIDSCEFQRLKWIEQGSFRILYPSARHDRFIHSLGVFHLGKHMFESFILNVKTDTDLLNSEYINEDVINKLKNTFLYACLLHDVGHAPFSHTCEDFFDNGNIDSNLISLLLELPDNSNSKFSCDFNSYTKPKPHEIISAIILVKKAGDFLGSQYNEIDLELAARMVTGITYQYNDETIGENCIKELGIKNCLIRMLNSDIVDVDKLDYLTRDTIMSGFDNISIDTYRLLRSVTAVKEDERYYPAYKKTSLSVIDNVFRAKTEQAVWVVSHPIVIYDSKLLQTILYEYNLENTNYIQTVFCEQAISKAGVSFNSKNYKLVSDFDVLSDIKSYYPQNNHVTEYFERDNRKHPIWKSYYELKHLCSNFENDEKIEDFVLFFKPLIGYLEKINCFSVDKNKLEEIYQDSDSDVDAKVKCALKFLKDFSLKNGLELTFTLIEAHNTFSAKINPDKIYILFNKSDDGKQFYQKYSDIKDNVISNDNTTATFFYLYSDKKLTLEQVHQFFEYFSSYEYRKKTSPNSQLHKRV